MERKAAKWLGLALVVAAALAWWRCRRARSGPDEPVDEVPARLPATTEHAPVPDPFPAPPAPSPVAGPSADAAPRWRDPLDGACPGGYPVKVNQRSGIYHVPGGLSYERTRPSRCYADPAEAEADGFRPAKR